MSIHGIDDHLENFIGSTMELINNYMISKLLSIRQKKKNLVDDTNAYKEPSYTVYNIDQFYLRNKKF